MKLTMLTENFEQAPLPQSIGRFITLGELDEVYPGAEDDIVQQWMLDNRVNDSAYADEPYYYLYDPTDPNNEQYTPEEAKEILDREAAEGKLASEG
jgi:hypothetical protein